MSASPATTPCDVEACCSHVPLEFGKMSQRLPKIVGAHGTLLHVLKDHGLNPKGILFSVLTEQQQAILHMHPLPHQGL